MNYCGREFSIYEIELIRQQITQHPHLSRSRLSRKVCEQLGWRKPNGELKEMSCRVAMLRMKRDGLLELPPPRNGNGNRKRQSPPLEIQRDLFLHAPINVVLEHVDLELVQDQTSRLWNQLIDHYHYLGYHPLPGAQLRYIARFEGEAIALLGFGASAWRVAPRDQWIGWSSEKRVQRLHLIINNARFLILPWVKSKNLASRLLALTRRRLADDWGKRYHYRPVLLETFVEIPRFQGTCYKADNWIYLGDTQGRGKTDRKMECNLPKKSIWVHPLIKNFQQKLCK